MSSDVLTIRNITAFCVTLEQCEVLPAIPISRSNTRTWIPQLTDKLEPTTTPLPLQIPSYSSTASETVHLEDICLDVAPFYTVLTTISTSILQSLDYKARPNPKLRLTFIIAAHKYSLDISGTEDRSTVLLSVSAGSDIKLTAIYLPSSSFLVLLQSINPEQWMSGLSDSVSLTQLSIPGSHNSPTHHRAMPSVRCQAVSIRKQLDNGVRFLDIRLQSASPTNLTDERLYLVHGAFSVTLLGYYDFRGLMDRAYAFLDQNPSETILISLKREGIGKANDNHLAHVLQRHYIDKDPARWFTEPQIPRLGKVRGKLVLIRRFSYNSEFATKYAPRGWGIDATSWADNCPFSIDQTGQLCIQDFYKVIASVNIDEKLKYVQEHLARAATASCRNPESRSSYLYINFASASNFWNTECWPEKIAARLNPALLDYLCRRHTNIIHAKSREKTQLASLPSTGVVICDWLGNNGNWDLVRIILAMNDAQRTNHASLTT